MLKVIRVPSARPWADPPWGLRHVCHAWLISGWLSEIRSWWRRSCCCSADAGLELETSSFSVSERMMREEGKLPSSTNSRSSVLKKSGEVCCFKTGRRSLQPTTVRILDFLLGSENPGSSTFDNEAFVELPAGIRIRDVWMRTLLSTRAKSERLFPRSWDGKLRSEPVSVETLKPHYPSVVVFTAG